MKLKDVLHKSKSSTKKLTVDELKIQNSLGTLPDLFKLVKSRKIPPEILKELLLHAEQYLTSPNCTPDHLREFLLKNPKLPTEALQTYYDIILTKIRSQKGRWSHLTILRRIVRHPNLPRELISEYVNEIINNDNKQVERVISPYTIFDNPSLTEEDIKQIFDKTSAYYYDMLSHKNCPVSILFGALKQGSRWERAALRNLRRRGAKITLKIQDKEIEY